MKIMGKTVVCLMCVIALAQLSQAQEVYTLGVLAPKGADAARQEWEATAEYLSESTGKTFTLVPLQLKSFKPAVKAGKIDFMMCNSTLFYQMQTENGAKPLASLIGVHQGQPLRGNGAVIFTVADSPINMLTDLKGKKVAALQQNALMGYQLQVYVLKKRGLEAGTDFSVSFAGKLPLVVKAVKSGAVDAGFAGANAIQWLKKNTDFSPSDFKVIEPEADDFPYQHTGPVLPFWVFGPAHNIDEALAKEVVAALKAMPADSPAAAAANIYGWEDLPDLTLVQEVLQGIQ
jgi:ABC-type phosphate/phosphonate transport system substrate-binding protein